MIPPLRTVTTQRVALVTGGGGGIGRAIARRLRAGGVQVALLDIGYPRGSTDGALELVCDITHPDEIEGAIREVLSVWGRVDVLVNNAGIAGRSAPIGELTDQDWASVLGVNLTGVFYCCRAIVPHMVARGWGRIINIASIAGKEGNPNAIPYTASKAGVIGLTKALAKELATSGVLVNAVTPAVIETDLLQQVSQSHVQYMVSRIPMARVGRPVEVAELVAWLASEACTFSTGAVFDISGGRATY